MEILFVLILLFFAVFGIPILLFYRIQGIEGQLKSAVKNLRVAQTRLEELESKLAPNAGDVRLPARSVGSSPVPAEPDPSEQGPSEQDPSEQDPHEPNPREAARTLDGEPAESQREATDPPPLRARSGLESLGFDTPASGLPASAALGNPVEGLAGELGEDLPKERAAAPGAEPVPAQEPFQWERWIGVRGAALLCGLLFALAAVLFFKHAFEQGWITPLMRVWMGAIFGASAMLAAGVLHGRGVQAAPGALAGAGLVAWYAATWAAHRQYGFLSVSAAMPLFISTTALGVWMSLRLKSQTVAVLGLLGGFATPLLLAVQQPSAPGFFSYLLALQIGLAFVARRGSFFLLPILAVLAAGAVQGLWLLNHLSPETLPFALAGVGGQVVVFVLLSAPPNPTGRKLLIAAQATALALVTLLLIGLSSRLDLAGLLPGQALLGAVVLAGALLLERRQHFPSPAVGVLAAAVTGSAYIGILGQSSSALTTWEPLILALPPLVALGAREMDRRRGAQALWTAGPLVVFVVAAVGLGALVVQPFEVRPVLLAVPALLVAIGFGRERYQLPGGLQPGPMLAAAVPVTLLALEASAHGPSNSLAWFLVALLGLAAVFVLAFVRSRRLEPSGTGRNPDSFALAASLGLSGLGFASTCEDPSSALLAVFAALLWTAGWAGLVVATPGGAWVAGRLRQRRSARRPF